MGDQKHPLAPWHQAIKNGDTSILSDILHEEVEFHSPVVWTPQKGKSITLFYLTAAYHVLIPGGFRYRQELVSDRSAVLEFVTEVEGITINGVDMLQWDEEGLLTEIKVMVRPRKAMDKLQELMARMMNLKT